MICDKLEMIAKYHHNLCHQCFWIIHSSIFYIPQKNNAPQLEKGGPAGAIYKCSHSGWSNEELFVDWLKHFINITKPTKNYALLMIADNRGSHITLESWKLCKENHIHVVSIPPHSSHRLQPLDLAFLDHSKRHLALNVIDF